MKEFIGDTLSHTLKFDGIHNLLVGNEDKSTVASGFASDKTVLVLAKTDLIETFDTPVCLGNLKYLGKVLSMDQIKGKQGVAEPKTGPSADGQEIIQEIKFRGPRVSIEYQATDPKVASIKRPNIKKMEWAVSAKLEPEHYREYSDAADLLKIVDPKADSFTAKTEDGELRFVFEHKSHRTIMAIGTQVEGELKNPVAFAIGKVRSALQLMADAGAGTVDISESAIKFWFKTTQADYTIVIPKRLVA